MEDLCDNRLGFGTLLHFLVVSLAGVGNHQSLIFVHNINAWFNLREADDLPQAAITIIRHPIWDVLEANWASIKDKMLRY